MSRLVYLCDWLPPDFGAVGACSLALARKRAAAGWDVVLVGLTDGPASDRAGPVGAGHLRVIARPRRPAPRHRLGARLGWSLASNLILLAAALPSLAPARWVVAPDAPPGLPQLASVAAALTGTRLIHRTTDFHAEILLAEQHRPGLAARATAALLRAWRRRVPAFEVLGTDQRDLLLRQGVPAPRIAIQRDPCPVPVTPTTQPAPRPAGLGDSTILLYSGSLGRVHDWRTAAAGLVRHHRHGSARMALWLNARGPGAARLYDALFAAGVPVAWTEPVPPDSLPAVLAAGDVHLITLRPRYAGLVMPSKIHAALAADKPVLFCGPATSDVHHLGATQAPAYRHCPPRQPARFAACLEALAASAGPAATASAAAR